LPLDIRLDIHDFQIWKGFVVYPWQMTLGLFLSRRKCIIKQEFSVSIKKPAAPSWLNLSLCHRPFLVMSRLPVLPSFSRQLINTICCLVAFTTIFVYFRRYVSSYPITLESIWQISLAEVNRRKNIRRIEALERKHAVDEEKGVDLKQSAVRQIASVVGYREEPGLFKKCLSSYRGSPGLEIMLVGVDGDGEDDMEMVRIAEEVDDLHLQESN
jgi:hypothetical protein